MADPRHHTNSVTKYFYKLSNANVGISGVTKCMAKRLKEISIRWLSKIKVRQLRNLLRMITSTAKPNGAMY